VLADVVYVFGILFQVLLLFRGWRSGTLNKYPYFYAYIATSFLAGILSYAVLLTRPESYSATFWPLEFLTLFIGCGLVLEIFRDVLSPYRGAERFAKSVCVVTFIAIFLFGLLYFLIWSPGSIAQSEVSLERNVRAVQVLFFVAIVGTIFYYGIALGKNIRGMIYGYGLYLGGSVVAFALRLYYHSKVDALRTVRPLIFDVSLFIWLISVWAYCPNPKPVSGDHLEEDYEAVVSLTKARVDALRSHLGRSTRG
jgi:hypothetical protein